MSRPPKTQWVLTLLLFCLWLLGCTATAVSPVTSTPLATQTISESAVLSPTPAPTTTPTMTATPFFTATATATVTSLPTSTRTPTSTSTHPPLPATTHTATATATFVPTSLPANMTDTAVSIADLATLAEGTEVTVMGQVIAASSFSGGFKFTLDDGTGQVVLLTWHDVYDECWDAAQLNLGASVQVTGAVGQYQGALQIQPDWGGDVQVITPGTADAPQFGIGTLNSHLGERVMIVGSILRLESGGSGVTLFVGDETGEIAVYIWRNVLDRIPNNVPLGVPGTRVRVVGQVQEFRSNYQLVPTLPYDVEVLP